MRASPADLTLVPPPAEPARRISEQIGLIPFSGSAEEECSEEEYYKEKSSHDLLDNLQVCLKYCDSGPTFLEVRSAPF
jgi:hypothetical protein